MDALYFRVSSEKQTTENQFENLLQVAEPDGAARGQDGFSRRLFRPWQRPYSGCQLFFTSTLSITLATFSHMSLADSRIS